jgi:hypothetical protein
MNVKERKEYSPSGITKPGPVIILAQADGI